MDSMFMDILGVLIGFVTIILLLSLTVTGLVQGIQAMLRLRGRNLQRGMMEIMKEVRGESKAEAREDALCVLNAPNIALLGRYESRTGLRARVIGPMVSWLNSDQLCEALKESGLNLGEDEVNKICNRFKQIEKPLEKRFLRNIRIWTILCSLVIAVYFQVSSLELLRDLSTDRSFRERIASQAEAISGYANEQLENLASYQDVSVTALERLVENHEGLRAALEEAGGTGESKEFILEEVELILENHPERTKLLAEYDKLLESLLREQRDEALAAAQGAIGRLAYFNIVPWGRGWAFFREWANWLGVLVTGVLISLGAPFWFNILKNMLNFRDALRKPPDSPAVTERQVERVIVREETVAPNSALRGGADGVPTA